MGRTERQAIISEIEHRRGSKLVCYLTSDRQNAAQKMMKDILPLFANHLRTDGKHEKVDVFIFTHGGDTLTGFGLARLIREYAKTVAVLIPDCCHSAGTLFALGANEIMMTRGATLSPIDPSIEGPLNPAVQFNPQMPAMLVPLSVESVAGYQSLITKEWRADKQALLKVLAERVHPLALGDVYRIRQQIDMLAKRLLEQHRKDKRNVKNIIYTLSKGLGSHDYLIYLTEAKQLLGKQISEDLTIESLVLDLYRDYEEDMQLGVPHNGEILLTQARAPAMVALVAAAQAAQAAQVQTAQAAQAAQVAAAKAAAAQAAGDPNAAALAGAAQTAAALAATAQAASAQAANALAALQQQVPQSTTAEIKLAIIESSAFSDVAIQRREISELMISLMPGMPPNKQVMEKITLAKWERRS